MPKPPTFKSKYVVAVQMKGKDTATGVYSGFSAHKADLAHARALERLYSPKSPVIEVICMSKDWLVTDA